MGKGRWIYIGLGLWRQLPAGTDGAYRLMANLLSLGDTRVRFSPDYVRFVLNENFEDAKAQFLAPLMAIDYAHLVMLAEQRIVAREEARARSARRWTASTWTRSRRSATTGPTRTSSSTSSG